MLSFLFYPCRFAFIEFPSVEDAKEALDSCNNTEIEGRTIRLEYSQTSGSQGGGCKCYFSINSLVSNIFKLEVMINVSDYP